MTRGVPLYLLGVSCVALGLAVAWIQSENHAVADELQRTERANLDLEVRIEALDNDCVMEVHRVLAGEPAVLEPGIDGEVIQ
ncbi:hypothetical protein [Engelhardtia mirabilis]|uniref:Uncharacterized protein n=1 Tax=Engelhardtia mirabilis TaxID=2528011 RepID=A0A518BIA4_9BACT|nr:hypothetical protein Pla133_17780 [Planctomycetes bacterium Pla133]QDV01028.1 hypothetical protein Pla86_17770 [Planctomycetes bacterium Pla86]